MPGRLINDVLYPLSGRRSSSAATFTRSTVSHDYAIAGKPFLSAVSNQYPLGRELAPIRKQQFDNSQEPGEQSLEGWWLRSQSSFHGGTNLKYREPLDETNELRFFDSLGVNVWTSGQATLLKSTSQKKAGSGTVYVVGIIDGSTDGYIHADGTTVTRETDAGSTAITWGGSGTILSLTTDGTNYYVADSTSIWRGTVAGGAGSAIWNTGSSNVVIAWVKQRLMAGIDDKIYELVGSGPGLPAAKFDHPNASWKWTSFAEGGSAIYAAGYAGATSAIYKFTLDSGGAVPTLTQGTVAAQLPLGEVVHSIYAYLGTFLAVGTNKGLRVGIIDQATGNLEVGALSIETTNPVKCMAGRDRFIWAGGTNALNSNSGLYRLDLGMSLPDDRFAYATDLQAGVSGVVDSVTSFGASARMVFGVTGQGSYLESATVLQSSGTLQTSRIRYSTLEPKLYKFARIRGSVPKGSLGVSTIDSTGGEVSLITYGSSSPPGQDLALTTFDTAQEFVSLKFTLTRDSVDTTMGPTLNGWQLKALPGVTRDEILTVPLLCFDIEKDKLGQRWGRDGHAVERYEALRDAVETGDLVSFQDLCRGLVNLVIVEDMRFIQLSPPVEHCRGFGGVIIVSMRAIT